MTNEQPKAPEKDVSRAHFHFGLTVDEAACGFDRFARPCREAALRTAGPSVRVVKLGRPPRRSTNPPIPIARANWRKS